MSVVKGLSKCSSSFCIPRIAYRNCDKRRFIPLPTTTATSISNVLMGTFHHGRTWVKIALVKRSNNLEFAVGRVNR